MIFAILKFYVSLVCRFKAHKQCASKAPRNCKWTTLDSIPPDLRLAGNNDDPVSNI